MGRGLSIRYLPTKHNFPNEGSIYRPFSTDVREAEYWIRSLRLSHLATNIIMIDVLGECLELPHSFTTVLVGGIIVVGIPVSVQLGFQSATLRSRRPSPLLPN